MIQETEYKAEEFKPSPDMTDVVEKLSKVVLATMKPGSLKKRSMTYAIPSTGRSPSTNSPYDGGFVEFEYPLHNIGAAEDTEVYIYQANFKKLALAMKEGFAFVGENQETLKYIEKRIKQLETAQGQTMFSLISEILGEMFRYHGALLIKARDPNNSGGFRRKIGEKWIEPVAGYFVASMTAMKPRIGKDNRITHWKHEMPDGRHKIYKAEDVVYFHINRRPHFMAPTPPWFPALDDVEALRTMEEQIEGLVYRHINPLFQYKVGTEKAPSRRLENGVTEVEYVQTRVDHMPSDGMIVTPERHEIIAIGAESQALRVEGYVKHFKDRVIAGTGLASIDFGDGATANRSTADSLSRIAIGNVKFYQKVMADVFNFEIMNELLLESSFGFDVLSKENYVTFTFAEVDIETKIKIQNHFMLLYAGEIITRTEARIESGMQALKPEQEADIKENAALIAAKMKPAPGASSSSDEMGSARSKQQPSNQHGTLSGPTKARSSVSRDSRAGEVYKSLLNDLYNMNPRGSNVDYVKQMFMVAETQIFSAMEDAVDENILRGMAGFERNQTTLAAARSASKEARDILRTDIERLLRDTSVKVMARFALERSAEGVLDSIEYRLDFILKTVQSVAFNLSRARVMRAAGHTKARVVSEPGGRDYLTYHGLVIDLLNAADEDLPPFHPNCKCIIEPIEE